ncbi:unnamed protein product [Soboliphyme baturini]|uniref:NADH dehydrogenase [ubiquinone] 1 beta subcomplex subunit 7 n=1 Tax=Soboliphyme baturini TaxID=241478 RepID=A0A183I9E6_9BILA|nr:unnamed protein product [Soboliphyme baturini]
MGSSWSYDWEGYKDPDILPDRFLPPRFDPLYGFPHGRKKREMKATEEEMVRWQLKFNERDYCAHTLIDYRKCIAEHFPLANFYCYDKKEENELCQIEDFHLRMKEYERERRLLIREKRLKEKLAREKQEFE